MMVEVSSYELPIIEGALLITDITLTKEQSFYNDRFNNLNRRHHHGSGLSLCALEETPKQIRAGVQ